MYTRSLAVSVPLVLGLSLGCAASEDQELTGLRADTGGTKDTGSTIIVDDDTGRPPVDSGKPPVDSGKPPGDSSVIDLDGTVTDGDVGEVSGDAGAEAPFDAAGDGAFVPFDGACGDAAADAASDTGDAGSCPTDMVLMSAPCGGASYCIDMDEVTNAKYQLFITAKGTDTTGQPPACGWNVDYKPTGGIPTGKDKHPVVAVDWCDAYAYCAWAGKHLCGKIGGGATPSSSINDTTKDEWFNACSSGGKQPFPYGSTFKPAWCNDKGFLTTPGTAMVRQASGCVVNGIYDLSGNAYEWTNTCDAETGKDDLCYRRGGSWNNDLAADLMCTNNRTGKRSEFFSNLGFRCCK